MAFEKANITDYKIHCMPYNTNFLANIDTVLKEIEELSDTMVKSRHLQDGFIGIGVS